MRSSCHYRHHLPLPQVATPNPLQRKGCHYRHYRNNLFPRVRARACEGGRLVFSHIRGFEVVTVVTPRQSIAAQGLRCHNLVSLPWFAGSDGSDTPESRVDHSFRSRVPLSGRDAGIGKRSFSLVFRGLGMASQPPCLCGIGAG